MSFIVTLNESEVNRFSTYHNALEFIAENLGQWNAYTDHLVFNVTVTKESDGGDIGVKVQDNSKTGDYFGGR